MEQLPSGNSRQKAIAVSFSYFVLVGRWMCVWVCLFAIIWTNQLIENKKKIEFPHTNKSGAQREIRIKKKQMRITNEPK